MQETNTERTEPVLNRTGEIRLVANRNGWFVVGKDLQFSVENREAGQALIAKLLNEPVPDQRDRQRNTK
jgi:hypothetical protein